MLSAILHNQEITWYNIVEVRYMNKSSSLLDLFIIYAIEILCNIKVDIIVNINIKLVLDIAVIQISYNFFYRTNSLYIKIHFFAILLQKFYIYITTHTSSSFSSAPSPVLSPPLALYLLSSYLYSPQPHHTF